MFRESSAHLQEFNDVNCICMQPLVSSFCAGGRLVQSLTGSTYQSPFSECTRQPPAEKDNTSGCIHIQFTSLLAIAQDGHLQRRTIPVAAYIYNLHH
jgi:hypothetical protein